MYAQTCTRPDFSFVVGMLGWYQSNPRLQGTKNHMLTNRKYDHLEVINYIDSDFVGYMDSRKSTFGCVSFSHKISWKSVK